MKDEERRHAIRLKLAHSGPPPGSPPRECIPTGSVALDAALGIGGLPRGAIVELFGPSGCGKTSLALSITAGWQRAGGVAAWIDAERSFDAAYAARLGVDLQALPVARPDWAEQAFAMMGQLALTGAVELLVVDSAAALTPALELETPLGESGSGLQSRVLGSELRKLARTVARSGATAIFLNQTRRRMTGAKTSEGEEVSAGGPALKLYAAVRVALEPAGACGAHFRVLKNKTGEPFREGDVRWGGAAVTGEESSGEP